MRISGVFSLFFLGLLLVGCETVEKRPTTSARPAPTPVPVAAAPSTAPVWPEAAPSIHAKYAVMIDARTGRTLYQKYADTTTPVASTQKLLTALIVVRGRSLDGLVTIQPEDARTEPMKLYLKTGQTYTRRQLLNAIVIKSANDAATALGRDYAGSVPAFAEVMNQTAWRLGATRSHFANPHGLPAAQYSTARDMARIAFAAYRDPELRRMMGTTNYLFQFANGRKSNLSNTNKLLGRSPGVNGMKTGFTNASGRCLISSMSIDGREVILAQFGSKSRYIFGDAERMMQWGIQRASGGFYPSSQPPSLAMH